MQGHYPNRLFPKEGGHQAGLRALESHGALRSHLLTHPPVLPLATRAMEGQACPLPIHSFTDSQIPTLPSAGREWPPAALANPRILCTAVGFLLTLRRPESPLSLTGCCATWDILQAWTKTVTCFHSWEPGPGTAAP